MRVLSLLFALLSIGLSESKSHLKPAVLAQKMVATNSVVKPVETPSSTTQALKLLVGAGGIYAAFLYYGTLQEDVFHYKAPDGTSFKSAWFLQAIEALANVVFGAIGLLLTGWTKGLPLSTFAISGATQVSAKAFTSLALANGLSFPVVTLAKSAKAIPVMIGSLLLGGASYTLREYLSVLAIIAGTCIVSLGNKKSSGPASSTLGIAFIALSLTCDGLTGGLQDRIKKKSKASGISPKPHDMMFWTNLFMAGTALVVAVALGDLHTGFDFCVKNPVILEKILYFAVCSAVGQTFIFYTISEFNSLVCTTVTTTRKVFSVLLSIFLHGHQLSATGWAGIATASAGILSELLDGKGHHKEKKVASIEVVKDTKKSK